jgi:DNA polymerase-3 subunit gamma/tau
MSQALYRKWRPHLWDEVIGQDHVVHTLKNAVRNNKVGHAYLFSGPRGTGKTTTARLLAKAVNCLADNLADRPCDKCDFCKAVNENRFLDLIEIDAASNTSVDDVRDLRDKINFSPTQGRSKIYIIDEVHMLSTAAFNALLKTLEEPPAHAIFILATTEVHKIPATVLSRCQRHEFRRIPVNDIVAQLRELAKKEDIQADDDALTLIARQSTGSLRDAISLLDQLSSGGEKVTLEVSQTVLGTATNQIVVELVEAILTGQAGAGLNCIHQALDSGSDPRQYARQVVDYLRGLLLVLLGKAKLQEVTPEQKKQMEKHAQQFTLPYLVETLRLFNAAAVDVRSGWQPALPLELALAEAIERRAGTGQPQVDNSPVFAGEALPQAVKEKSPSKSAVVQSHSTPVAAPQPVVKEEPAPAKAESPTQELDMREIEHNWAQIKALVKRKRNPTEALLNSCKLLAVKRGTLVLGFVTDILKNKMEAGDNLDVTRQAIRQVIGKDVPLACVVMSGKTGSLPPELDVDGDGLVGTALNLGGEIVHKE